MTRNYVQYTTTIWFDDDFRELPAHQQALYFLLKGQPETTAAGTLPLRPRRWSRMASDWTIEGIEKAIAEMQAAGHVMVDEATEEVLVVKFVKWDKGYNNPKRVPMIRESALAIESLSLRRTIAIELASLGLSELADELGFIGNRPPIGDNPGLHRVVVNVGDHESNPLTATRKGPQTANPIPAAASGGPPSMFCSKHPNGTEESCGPCGTAKLAYSEHVRAKTDAEVEARRAAAAARDACPLCDDRGMRLHPESHLPVGRCDHQPFREEPS